MPATQVEPKGTGEQDYYSAAQSWDLSMQAARERSERRAWWVALGAGGLALLSWVALVLLLPLKQTLPYVIRVDSATGVPDIVTTLKAEDVGTEEVTQKYFLADYIRARETYDAHTLQQDYNRSVLYSSPTVAKEYASQFEGPDALDKKYGSKTKATVEILSVVPTSSTTGTVRFSKKTELVDRSLPPVETRWVATVAFAFNGVEALKESERLINPFGFQVLSYRVDPELVGGAQ